MSGNEHSGSDKSRRPYVNQEDLATRPHRRPIIYDTPGQTLKLDAVVTESTVELSIDDEGIVEVNLGADEATETIRRDDILRYVKADRRESEEEYNKATIRVPAIVAGTVPDRPSVREQAFGPGPNSQDAHLRHTVDVSRDEAGWVEFVCEVDRNGSLVLPIEFAHSKLFKPGRSVLVRAYGLDE